jgi:hypothetical protein
MIIVAAGLPEDNLYFLLFRNCLPSQFRSILRAPEIVQQMYRDGYIAQTVAARMGPKSPIALPP